MATNKIKLKAEEIIGLKGFDDVTSFVIRKKFSDKDLTESEWNELLIQNKLIDKK